MSMSTDGPSKFVRAAVVSGLLGAAGLVAVATPAMAQDNGSGTNGSGTTNGSGNGSGNGSDLGTTTTGGTATTGGATTAPITASDSGVLPHTGGTATTSLALGGAAVGIALAGRRLLASRA